MRFTSADISARFDPRVLLRGRQYWQQHRVRFFALHEQEEETRIDATVEGSEAMPYALTVNVTAAAHGPRFDSECSCPVGGDCKHVIAALCEACNRWQRGQGRAPAAAPSALPHEVQDWLAQLAGPQQTAKSAKGVEKKQLLYIMDQSRWRPGAIHVQLYSVRLLRDGSFSPRSMEMYHNVDGAMRQPPKFMTEDDQELLRGLYPYRGCGGEYELRGGDGVHVLQRLLASTRCHWQKAETAPLRLGVPRPGNPHWQAMEDGSQRLSLQVTPAVSGLLA
ncbi:MAG: SWIM zinc finger family protein, partial [Stenotrophobium sp.]